MIAVVLLTASLSKALVLWGAIALVLAWVSTHDDRGDA
jgi:hypothetical protein